jgi:hypothetical protein
MTGREGPCEDTQYRPAVGAEDSPTVAYSYKYDPGNIERLATTVADRDNELLAATDGRGDEADATA